MQDCANCGAILESRATHCHVCGVTTPYQKTQRLCLNCGSPVTRDAKICVMCGHRIDAIPQRGSTFGVSWPGVAVGLTIVASLIYWFFQMRPPPAVEVSHSPTPSASFTPLRPTATRQPTFTPSPPPTFTATSPAPTATPAPVIHTIRRGETLLFIADRYNVSVVDIMEANPGISNNTILQIDQQLTIPVNSDGVGGPGLIRAGPVITYIVKSGDTLSDIAFEYDVSLALIGQANPDIDLDILSIGQEIVIPLEAPTLTPTPTITSWPILTPGPPLQTPHLLLPPDEALIEGDEATILLSWTASAILDEKTFYAVSVTDEAGQTKTYLTQASSYRLPAEMRPPVLTTYTWQVVVMEVLSQDENGNVNGIPLSDPSTRRSFSWR